jgi:type IV pilus assembly protein PilW
MKRTRSVAPVREVGFFQAGFTLVEMMVAVTVSLFVIGALVTVVLGSASTGRTREQASDLQINGRYALEQIRTDLLHSGFLGITGVFDPDQPITAASPTISVANACDVNTVGMISQRVRGSNDANAYAATCIPAANYSTGDLLVIRSLNPNVASPPYRTTRAYYYSAYEAGRPFVGPTVPALPGNAKDPKLVFEIRETVYYISPFTTSAAESPEVPALYRAFLSEGPAMARELVATGVENLQVRFGVFQSNSTIKYLSSDEIATDDWDMVNSVQVWLLMRSAMPDSGYQNNNTYSMGEQNVTVNDGYRRLLLSSTIELRN